MSCWSACWTKEGYEAGTVSSGEEALVLLESSTADLVLLDVGLPGLDGFEVCALLEERPETRLLPIVLITGRGDRESRIRGIRSGCDDFCQAVRHRRARSRVRSLVRLKQYTDDLDSTEAILRSLALTIEARDAYTQGHCDRLANILWRSAASSGCCLKICRRSSAAPTCTTSARSPSPTRC